MHFLEPWNAKLVKIKILVQFQRHFEQKGHLRRRLQTITDLFRKKQGEFGTHLVYLRTIKGIGEAFDSPRFEGYNK